MGRGKRQSQAATRGVARELPLSDPASGRSRPQPEISASSAYDPLLGPLYRVLAIKDEDQLKEPLADDQRLVTPGATEKDGELVVWTEKTFKSEPELRDALAAQAEDRDDPNPLPVAVVRVERNPDGVSQTELLSLSYSAVHGLAIGDDLAEEVDEEMGEDELGEVLVEFRDWLYDEYR